MGSLRHLIEMVPSLNRYSRDLPTDFDDAQIKRVEAIIRSMTPEERRRPEILNGSRRRRIARGSGATPQDINRLLSQFKQTQKMMRQFSKTRNPRSLLRMFG